MGDPRIHTPSTVSVQPIQRLRFQRGGKGSMCGKCFYAYACLRMCVCVCVKRSDQSQVALHSHLLSLVFGCTGPEYCKVPPVSDCCGQVS